MDEELDKILVTTMNDVPGYEIVAVYGEVFGLIVRARNVFSNLGASLRTAGRRRSRWIHDAAE